MADDPIPPPGLAARGAAAGALAGPGGRPAASGGEGGGAPTRVIVAGAGMAGLAAAYELVRRGHDVTVLEARDRPGGRARTLRSFDDGLYAEAGATYVLATHHHTVGFARELGVPLVPVGGKRTRYFARGHSVVHQPGTRFPWPSRLLRAEQGLLPGALLSRYVHPLLAGIGDPEDPSWPSGEALRHDGTSFAEMLRRRGASAAAIRMIGLGYLAKFGDGIKACSALSLLRDIRLLGAPAYRIDGGTDRLPRAFAERLGARIRYGVAVTGIDRTDAGVRITYRDAAGEGTLAGDCLVCAIPFAALRAVRVSPPFSPGKRRAVEGLRTTAVTRVYLQLRSRCWAPGEGDVATDLPVMSVGDATEGQPGERAVLEAFITGARARRVAAMPPRRRISFVLDHVERVHPGARSAFEHGVSYCWGDDPWAGGGYAWFAPGEMEAFLPHLAPPEGRVHFAGDHVSASPGWMQGALASGVRAAREVHALAAARSAVCPSVTGVPR